MAQTGLDDFGGDSFREGLDVLARSLEHEARLNAAGEAPWLTRLQPLGQAVPLVLETNRGTVAMEGETVVSTFDIHRDDTTFSTEALRREMPSFPALQQCGVRYRWDGEETFGMLERSNPLDKISRD
jgi:RIO-like serine/threonine protein kinase